MSGKKQKNHRIVVISLYISLTLVLLFNSPVFGIGPYIDNGDTVTDNATGLEWQKSDDGVPRNWELSLEYCSDLTLGGSDAWRLPNIKELDSLVDLSTTQPAIDPAFPFCELAEYWSSTSYDLDESAAWSVNFEWGHDDIQDKSTENFVRCVRGNATLLPSGGTTTLIGGSTNVPVQNGHWLFFSVLTGCYLLFQRRRSIK